MTALALALVPLVVLATALIASRRDARDGDQYVTELRDRTPDPY